MLARGKDRPLKKPETWHADGEKREKEQGEGDREQGEREGEQGEQEW